MLLSASRAVPASQLYRSAYVLLSLGQTSSFATASAAAEKVVEITSDTDFAAKLKSVAESGSLAVVDFTAKWCGPCRMIAPIYSQLAQKYPSVSFLKVDIDNPGVGGVVNDHSITGVPTFVYYKGGRRVESFSGARPDMLEDLIKKHSNT